MRINLQNKIKYFDGIILPSEVEILFKEKVANKDIAIAIRWLKKLDNYTVDITAEKIMKYINLRHLRTTNLKNQGKHTSIIDESLYILYANTPEQGIDEYKRFVKTKTKWFCDNITPEKCDNTSLKAYIKKYGDEEGRNKHNLYRELQRKVANTTIHYWIAKGYSEAEAKDAVSKRQSTFSLEKCIEKYGDEEGRKIWQNRQDRWMKTMSSKSEDEIVDIHRRKMSTGGGVSKESMKRCMKYISFIEGKYGVQYQYGNNEFSIKYSDTNRYFYDFTDTTYKIIIEYHGTKFHVSPKLSEDEKKLWRGLGKYSYEESLERDKHKKKTAEDNGFTVFEIWSDHTNVEVESIFKEIERIYHK
jgi:very-short-patch-repair endonuclease